jgi:transposase
VRKKEYKVCLSAEERALCLEITKKGQAPARVVNRAHVLLLADDGAFDKDTAAALHIGPSTVGRTRKRFAEGGLEAALDDRPHPGAARKLDGKQEAFLIALTCSNPPEGRERWTLHLLAGKMVELEVVDSLSHETVRRVLKKGA